MRTHKILIGKYICSNGWQRVDFCIAAVRKRTGRDNKDYPGGICAVAENL